MTIRFDLIAQAADDEAVRFQRDISGLLQGIAIVFFVAAGIVVLWIVIRSAVTSGVQAAAPKRPRTRANQDAADALSRIEK